MQQRVLKKIILIVFCVFIIAVTLFFIMNYRYEAILEKAFKAGESAEFSGYRNFSVKEGPVTYFYKLGIADVKFVKYEIVVEEPDVEVKKGELIVSVQNRDKNGKQIEGSYHDKRVVIEEDGTEKAMYSGMFFISNRNFDKSSLVTTGWIDAEQKAIEAYESVTGYVPVEELKQYYNRALTICNQLNE